MGLKRYKAKRKFDKTPEPRGVKPPFAHSTRLRATGGLRPPTLKLRGATRKSRFVIHKHWARSLHYDLRLEINGVLKSWAAPKQPPLRKGVKRLAVQVEDHPIEYLNFSGVIPEGNYGAGRVEIWDRGVYELDVRCWMLDVENADSFKFEFKGKKLKGEYVLVRLKDKNWLFFKTN